METPNGYKWYKKIISGYTFTVFETPDNFYSFGAPMGDTLKQKKMFDELVYQKRSIYNGWDKEKIINNIKNFIKNYE